MTSPYYVQIAPTARRQFNALPLKSRKVIFKMVEALAVNPRPPGAKKIDGMTGLYRHKIEQIRLVYKIDEMEILLLLVK